MGTFANELIGHVLPADVGQVSVPRSGSGQASWEDRRIVSLSDGERAVLEAKAIEAETRNRSDIAHAWSSGSSDQSDFLLQGQLRDEAARLLESSFPALPCGIRYDRTKSVR
jgi:hypothetical protein